MSKLSNFKPNAKYIAGANGEMKEKEKLLLEKEKIQN